VSLHAAQISTFAGTGAKGFSGDGGPATAAQLNQPFGITRGPDGALYVCDTGNHRIRRVALDGTISTVAGNGTHGWSGDGGSATSAALNEPYEVRFDTAGNMFFVERLNHLVRRVDAKSGIISTIAGTGVAGFSGDGGAAVKAQFSEPHSIGFDSEGDLYICDIRNHRVRKVDMKSGNISTFAGNGERKPTPEGKFMFGDKVPLHGPRALDFNRSGGLVLALREGNSVYDFGMTTRIVHRIAGTGKQGFTGNGGSALEATLSGPKGVSIAPNGNIYLADTESDSIRMLDMARGTIELVAGTGAKGDGPDGDPLACKLARPHGVFVDKDGAVFIGDSENHRVRVLRP
jgi:DNA-binding beta-propeller fold protein YncE